jgi:cytoskeletal protein CcmA (bactofilin family)
MRRAQLLSLDAMLSLIIVVFILAAVTNTSSALKGEITSLVEWHERANIAEDMLDVLINTPGEPENWTLNTSTVIVPGLCSNTTVGIGLDYLRVYTLFHGIEANDSSIIKSLYNLAGKKDFQMAIFLRENTLDAILKYQSLQGNWLQICHVKDLVDELGNPSDSPALLYCPGGKVRFDHNGVNYNTYTNNRYMCINSSAYIGDNFHVITKEYTAINGDLQIKADGSLNVSDLYLEGDGTFESNARVTTSGDAHVGGDVDIKSDGHMTVGGYGYFHGEVEVESSGYLTVGNDLYVDGPLKIHNNGNLKVGGSVFINDYLEAENSAHLDIGKELYVNGDLRSLEYNAEIKTGGDIYIKGSATVKGDIYSGGGLYVNGPMTIDYGSEVVVNGDLYVNGKLNVKGTLTVHGNVYINGDLSIEWNKKVTIDGDLYTTGRISGDRSGLTVGGEMHEHVSSLPWDESKLNFTITIPPMKHAPCMSGAFSFSIVANVTVNMSYSPAEFYSNWEKLAVINGTLFNGSEIIRKSKERSPWIEHEERMITLARIKYQREYNITNFSKPQELYIGHFVNPVPPQSALAIEIPKKDGNLSLISVFFRGNTWGYSVITLIEKNSNVYPIGEMTVYTGGTKNTEECTSITVSGRTVLIPWKCIAPSATYTEPTNFLVSLYRVKGFDWIDVADLGSVNVYMEPVYSSGKIELWVWDDS